MKKSKKNKELKKNIFFLLFPSFNIQSILLYLFISSSKTKPFLKIFDKKICGYYLSYLEESQTENKISVKINSIQSKTIKEKKRKENDEKNNNKKDFNISSYK